MPSLEELVSAALAEDIAGGDATTLALVSGDLAARAVVIAREPCVVCGQAAAAAVFAALDPRVTCTARLADGAAAAADEVVTVVAGPARAILTGERTALNFMQRLGGIATRTRAFVARVAAYGTLILDTRKTTPGWRELEKYAVRCGGGTNHRMGLYDRILVKDNHRTLRARGGGTADLEAAVRDCRTRYPELAVEVEIETDEEFASALRAAPDWILLDNMSPARMRRYVALAAGKVRLEASGGITLDNVAAVAASGVDAVSLGCLTHSVAAVDLSLEIEDG